MREISPGCEPIRIGTAEITHYNTHDPWAYVAQLQKSSDEELYEICRQIIWLAAYAANNWRSDYHWMCDACYDECKRRGKIEQVYSRAYQSCLGEVK